jgi:hypothetical protein
VVHQKKSQVHHKQAIAGSTDQELAHQASLVLNQDLNQAMADSTDQERE